MQISDIMTRDVRLANPDDTIQWAARMMAQADVGLLPVSENDRLIGMITDRDIAVRGVAEGKGPDATIRSVMTEDVKYCFEDDDVGKVTQNMAEIQVRRLPVLDRNKRLVGIVSLGDVVAESGPWAAQALTGISEPGGQHCQSIH